MNLPSAGRGAYNSHMFCWIKLVLASAGVLSAWCAAQRPVPEVVDPAPDASDESLTLGRTFEPLSADPRYARFSAAYVVVEGNDYVNVAGVVSFGETLAIIRRGKPEGSWELGVQPVLYATFDMDNLTLFNTDYFFSLYAAARRGKVSVLARTYHDSSHLGDEFLLNAGSGITRENTVVDGLQVIGSYDISDPLRVYGGASWYYNREIESQFQFQYGAELEVRQTWLLGGRPVAAVDVQHLSDDGHDFNPDVTLRAGLRFGPGDEPRRRFDVLGEFYSGRDLNGQFVAERVHHAGIVFQFSF